MLSQRLGRSFTLNAIQQQVVYELPANQIQQAGLSQDLSVAAYYALVILLFALFPFRKPIIQTVQSLFIVVQALLIAIDIHLLQTSHHPDRSEVLYDAPGRSTTHVLSGLRRF